MGQVWYTPLVEGENFSDEVFNEDFCSKPQKFLIGGAIHGN